MLSPIQSLNSIPSTPQFQLIPRVGVYLHGMFSKKYSLCGRIDLNWRDMIMVVGVATAVTGVCLAIFYKMALAAWGFAFLSAIQLFAARYVHKYQTLKDLENVVSRLSALNLDLNQAKLKLDGMTQSLQAENQKLANMTKELERTNGNLNNTNRDLSQTNQNLTNTNSGLTQNNQRLETTLESIRGRLIDFGNQNLAFRDQVSGLGSNAQRFQDLYGQFDSSLNSMQELVNRSRELAEDNLRRISDEKRTFEDEMKKLKGVVDGNIQLADKLKVLNEYEKHIKDHEQALQVLQLEQTRVSTEIKLDRIALNKVKEEIKIEVDSLQRVRGQLQQDAHSIHLVTNQLTNQVNQNLNTYTPNSQIV